MRKIAIALLTLPTLLSLQLPVLAVPGWAHNSWTMFLYPEDCAREVTNSFTRPKRPSNSNRVVIRIPLGLAPIQMAQVQPGVFLGSGFTNETGVFIWCTPSAERLCSRTASTLIIFATSDQGSNTAMRYVDRIREQIGDSRLIDCSS